MPFHRTQMCEIISMHPFLCRSLSSHVVIFCRISLGELFFFRSLVPHPPRPAAVSAGPRHLLTQENSQLLSQENSQLLSQEKSQQLLEQVSTTILEVNSDQQQVVAGMEGGNEAGNELLKEEARQARYTLDNSKSSQSSPTPSIPIGGEQAWTWAAIHIMSF